MWGFCRRALCFLAKQPNILYFRTTGDLAFECLIQQVRYFYILCLQNSMALLKTRSQTLIGAYSTYINYFKKDFKFSNYNNKKSRPWECMDGANQSSTN
jgi:hypothetical protein